MTRSSDPNPSSEPHDSGPLNQTIRHAPVAARVPPHVARGVLATGVIVFEGPQEFVLDFVQRLGPPHSVVGRVVMPHAVFGQYHAALEENLRLYTERFGPPPPMPIGVLTPSAPHPAAPGAPESTTSAGEEGPSTIEDVYDQVRLPDEMTSGVYANAVMISHSPAEFWFDFITNFYPRSAVSARVYLSAQQILRIRETLHSSWRGHLGKRQRGERPASDEEQSS